MPTTVGDDVEAAQSIAVSRHDHAPTAAVWAWPVNIAASAQSLNLGDRGGTLVEVAAVFGADIAPTAPAG
ncbi:MAG: hypothetical protein ABSG53_07775 [Thermoguttaceae bacterium]|jgi:hypothetical protein